MSSSDAAPAVVDGRRTPDLETVRREVRLILAAGEFPSANALKERLGGSWRTHNEHLRKIALTMSEGVPAESALHGLPPAAVDAITQLYDLLHAQAKGALAEVRLDLERREQELAAERARLEKSQAAALQQIAALQDQLRRTENQATEAQAMAASDKANLQTLQAQHNQLLLENGRLSASKDALQAERDRLTTVRNALERDCETARKEARSLSSQVNNLTGKAGQLELQVQLLARESEGHRKTISTLQSDLAQAREAGRKTESALHIAERDLAVERQGRDQDRRAAAERLSDAKQFYEAAAKDRGEQYQRDLAAREAVITELRESLRDAEEELRLLRGQGVPR